MNFLSNQTDQLGMCILIHADKNNNAFIADKYVVGDHVDDETVIMVDNIDDAHHKCIDMIIKNIRCSCTRQLMKTLDMAFII